jgi:hypothetical protein
MRYHRALISRRGWGIFVFHMLSGLLSAAICAVLLLASPPVSNAGTLAHADVEPNVALDSQGHRHFVWQRRDADAGIYYATDASGTLLAERVTSNRNDMWPVIAVDGLDQPHVAFTHSSAVVNAGIFYATRNAGGSWTSKLIAPDRLNQYGVGLAVEADGTAHLAWDGSYEGHAAIVHATNEGGSFRLSKLRDGYADQRGSVAVGNNGKVYVAVKPHLWTRSASGHWGPAVHVTGLDNSPQDMRVLTSNGQVAVIYVDLNLPARIVWRLLSENFHARHELPYGGFSASMRPDGTIDVVRWNPAGTPTQLILESAAAGTPGALTTTSIDLDHGMQGSAAMAADASGRARIALWSQEVPDVIRIDSVDPDVEVDDPIDLAADSSPVSAVEWRVRSGSQLAANGSVVLDLDWRSTVTGTPGAHFDVEKKTGTGPFGTLVSDAPSLHASDSGRVGQAYQYGVREHGAPGYVLNEPSKLSLAQESAFTFTKPWTLLATAGASGGHTRWSKVKNATASYGFTGRMIALVAPVGANLGKATVQVDGFDPTTIDLHASAAKARVVVWAMTFPTADVHVLKITLLQAKRFEVDAVLVHR